MDETGVTLPSIRIDHLSPREREVLTLAGNGLSSKEIARRLTISPRTVDTHIANAISALGARNRLEAAMLLKQNRSVEIRTQPPDLAVLPLPTAAMPPDRERDSTLVAPPPDPAQWGARQ